jgi:hypothetical protein
LLEISEQTYPYLIIKSGKKRTITSVLVWQRGNSIPAEEVSGHVLLRWETDIPILNKSEPLINNEWTDLGPPSRHRLCGKEVCR